ncbi:MAG: glycosyltransferase, partial [Acetobacter sp.]|nr:glycosyltransferase [Acetobacter sp.]
MRIALVTDIVGNAGGTERLHTAVCSFLQKAGHDVTLFVLDGRGRASSWWREAGICFFLRPRTLFINRRHRMYWLSEHLKKWKPDLIWTCLERSTLLGSTLGHEINIPVVSWYNMGHWCLHLLAENRDRVCLWIGDSRSAGDLLTQCLPADRIATWPPHLFNEGTFQLAQPWKPGTPISIGSLGRLAFQKGYEIVIKALYLLDADTLSIPFHITIVGDGPERNRLKNLITQYNVQRYIHFTGASLEDPRSFLSSLHLYLQPSMGEGFCIAAHEAMQVGLPVIASNVGELKYSVQNDQTGWSIPPDDPIALRDALKFAL